MKRICMGNKELSLIGSLLQQFHGQITLASIGQIRIPLITWQASTLISNSFGWTDALTILAAYIISSFHSFMATDISNSPVKYNWNHTIIIAPGKVKLMEFIKLLFYNHGETTDIRSPRSVIGIHGAPKLIYCLDLWLLWSGNIHFQNKLKEEWFYWSVNCCREMDIHWRAL